MDPGFEGLDRFAPIGCEVLPSRIHALNQGDALGSIQSFDLLLAMNGVVDVFVFFVVDEPVDFLFLCESLYLAFLVLKHSLVQAVRHTGVNAARFARHDVNPESVFAHTRADPSLRS